MKQPILTALFAGLFILLLSGGAAAANTTSSGNFTVNYASEVAMGESFTISATDSNNVTKPGLGCAWSAGIAGSGQSFALGNEWSPGQTVSLKTDMDLWRFGLSTNYTQTLACADGDGNTATFSLPLSSFAPTFSNFLINIPVWLAANPMIVLLGSIVLFIILYALTLVIGPHLK